MSIDTDTQSHLRTRVTRAVRQKTGFSERLATFIAAEIIDGLVDQFRGERIYIGRSRIERDSAVLIEFNGRNHTDVCERHDISRATLYRILQKRGSRQGDSHG